MGNSIKIQCKAIGLATAGRMTAARLVGICAVATIAYAPVSDVRANSLTEIVNTALETHPAVAASRSGFKAAKHGVDEERAGFLPQLSASGDSGYQNSRRASSTNVTRDLYRNTQRLEMTQLLFDAGETGNLVLSAKATAEASRYELLAAATQIGQRAINAYLNVARDRELVQASVENINFHRNILSDVTEAARQGGGAGSRVAQVRTRLLNAQSQRRRLEANLRNSIEDYIEAVGQPPGDVARPAVPAEALPVSLDDALPAARKNSFDLLASTERERAAARSADATRGVFLPSLDLQLAHERRDNTDGTRGLDSESTVLVRLTWDFYTGGRDTASLRQALEERSEARYQIREVDRLLREDLAVALNNYDAAKDQVVLQEERLRTAVEVRNAYQQQFRLAQRTVLDLLDSSNEQFVAETDAISTNYEMLQSSFEVLALSGTLLDSLSVKVDMDGAPAR